jgi:phosphohistidine phosphatase
MDLILWRHAEAEDGTPDNDRALTAKGIKEAARMGKWLRDRLPPNALVLASPAKRTRQTAWALTPDFKMRPELAPNAGPEKILAAVDWPRGDRTVVVVGHQPTLGEVAALLLTRNKEEWGIKKGALIWIVHHGREGTISTQLYAALSPDLL